MSSLPPTGIPEFYHMFRCRGLRGKQQQAGTVHERIVCLGERTPRPPGTVPEYRSRYSSTQTRLRRICNPGRHQVGKQGKGVGNATLEFERRHPTVSVTEHSCLLSILAAVGCEQELHIRHASRLWIKAKAIETTHTLIRAPPLCVLHTRRHSIRCYSTSLYRIPGRCRSHSPRVPNPSPLHCSSYGTSCTCWP